MHLAEYTTPVLIATTFYGSRIHSAYRLKKTRSGYKSRTRRRVYAACVGTTALTWAALALETAAHASAGLQSSETSHTVVASAMSALLWIAIWRQATSDRQTPWIQLVYTAASAIAANPLLTNVVSSKSVSTGATTLSRVLLLANMLALSLSLGLAGYFDHVPSGEQSSKVQARTDKSKPETDAALTTASSDEYDSDSDSDIFPADSEYAKQKKEIIAKQRARLEQAGNWLAYLAAYKIFLPLIFPFGNRKLQAGMLYLVFHLAFTQILSFLVPHQMGVIADKLVSIDNLKTDFPIADIMFWGILQLFESELCYAIREAVFQPINNYVYKSICNTAFRHVMNLSMDFHHDKSSSDVIGTVHQGENLTQFVSFICFDLSPLVADIFIAITYITMSFEPYLMLIMLTGGVINCWLSEDCNKWARKQRKQYNEIQHNMSKSQYEALSNWQTVSQFNHNKYESDKYSKYLDTYCEQDNKITMVYNITGLIRGCFMLFARLAATALIMLRVSQGKIPLGQLVTFTAVWDKVMDPISNLQRLSRRVQNLMSDSERLLILLSTKATVQDKPDAKEFDFKAGNVQLNNVDFSYDTRKPTLSGVSVDVPAGSTVALVGETGGGKTTLIRMLYRYYDVTGGAIRIDGQDLRDVKLDSLRNIFGFVPQDPALFNTTLLENLRYARLDATDADIEEACKAACIHDKIMQFPDKYLSKVGERGVKLSGGEMQRVAVARAILRDPKIVLLDEATSMIDAETEHLIQQALRRLTAGRTTFVVAHRLSTIQHADLILVIENGKIIERGNHEELFRQGGKYVKLWSKQMSKHVDMLAKPVVTGIETPPHSDSGEAA